MKILIRPGLGLAGGTLVALLSQPSDAHAQTVTRPRSTVCAGVACPGSAMDPGASAPMPLRLRVVDNGGWSKTYGGSSGDGLYQGGGVCIVLGLLVGLIGLGVALGTPTSQPASLVVAYAGGGVFFTGVGLLIAGFVSSIRDGISRNDSRQRPAYALAITPVDRGATFGLTIAF